MRAGLLLVGILMMAAAANALPAAYLTEKVSATYLANGSLYAPVSKTGYVEVDVSNGIDVLQYLRLNFSHWNGTNLNSLTAYRDVAASPLEGQRTRIYVNTASDPQDLSYRVYDTENNTPAIGFRMEYSNVEGGQDLRAGGNNTLNVTVYFTSNMNLLNSTVTIQLSKNTFAGRDIANISTLGYSLGTAYANDTNGNGDRDRIVWNGNLAGGVEEWVNFLARTTPGTNFDEDLLYADMDLGYGATAYAPRPATFTGITFSNLFTRGPFQEGIDLLLTDKWKVRGFLKNTAHNLTYTIDGWQLYRVGENDSLLASNATSTLQPEEIKFTDWYIIPGAGKPNYFTSAFNWQASWAPPKYQTFTESRMNLPTVHEIDIWTDKQTSYNYDLLFNKSYLFVTIEDTVMHIGSPELGIGQLVVDSTYPYRSNAGTAILWNITDVQVFFGNLTNQTEITENATVQIIRPDENNSGVVRLNISSLSSVIGKSLQQNEHITLKYRAFHPSPDMREYFKFGGNATATTDSGTPIKKSLPLIDVGEAPPPPYTGPPWSPPVTKGGQPAHAEIVEERAILTVEVNQTESIVTVTAGVRVEDNGDLGIGNVSLTVRLPEDGIFDPASVRLLLFDANKSNWMPLEGEYVIRQAEAEEIGGTRYRAYTFTRDTTGWRLYNGDQLQVKYSARLPFGTQHIITEFSGFNYYVNRKVTEGIRTPLRVTRPAEAAPSGVSITESEYEQEKATVGKPVFWIKRVRAKNNGTAPAEAHFRIRTFQDSLDAKIFGEGDYAAEETTEKGSRYLKWSDEIPPLAEKEYLIKAVTPPVIKKDERTEVVESNRDLVKFISNVTLENLAREDYSAIYFEYPLDKEKLLGITGGEKYLDYGNESITIYLPKMDALELKTVGIRYKEKPPILIVTPKKRVFSDNCDVNISALVVSAERLKGPYLEMEVADDEGEVHADIIPLKELDVGERIETWRSFCIDAASAGNYSVTVRFRKDLTTVLTKKEKFQVASVTGHPQKNLLTAFAIMVLALLIAARVEPPLRRYLKERRVKKAVGGLRSDLKEKIRDYQTERVIESPPKINDLKDLTVPKGLYEESRQRLEEARQRTEREKRREELQKMLSEEIDEQKKRELIESIEKLKKLIREDGEG